MLPIQLHLLGNGPNLAWYLETSLATTVAKSINNGHSDTPTTPILMKFGPSNLHIWTFQKITKTFFWTPRGGPGGGVPEIGHVPKREKRVIFAQMWKILYIFDLTEILHIGGASPIFLGGQK